MSNSDVRFIAVIIILMLLFYGEPDLFDAMRAALVRYFNHI